MTGKVIGVTIVLFVLTSLLCVAVFQWHYRDYFFVREVYRDPQPAHRERLLEIAGKGYHRKSGYTAMSMMLARAFMELGDANLAVQIARRQNMMNPNDMGILWTYADALAMDGRHDEAARIYETLLQHARARRLSKTKEE